MRVHFYPVIGGHVNGCFTGNYTEDQQMSTSILSCTSNGVAHSTAFSALVATTRNPELDALSKGHCMGSLPLDKEMAKTRLRLGELKKGALKEMAGVDGSVEIRHLILGFEADLVRLRKGGVYVEYGYMEYEATGCWKGVFR
ncbi:hypothetical protein BOTCAL_0002g00070 [Botryotinia calthae]|uniref:Uncharacterized protein n=1 Tax=Botryotinia calthae TaxID=38488 RepID=A0A4Y8DI38_9HELO|nr:hypothetical protein BOTCAL_0002g00070 [Botryotinia calthae]